MLELEQVEPKNSPHLLGGYIDAKTGILTGIARKLSSSEHPLKHVNSRGYQTCRICCRTFVWIAISKINFCWNWGSFGEKIHAKAGILTRIARYILVRIPELKCAALLGCQRLSQMCRLCCRNSISVYKKK